MTPVERAIEVAGGASALARLVGVSASAPLMWRSRKSTPAEYCAAIERATNGAVMRWDLRPDDWLRIWPELADVPGAPSIPTQETQHAA